MTDISTEQKMRLFETIPDFINWNVALNWIKEKQKFVSKIIPKQILEEEVFSLEWHPSWHREGTSFGLYPIEKWRKLVLAIYFADIVSYPHITDQVAFERLLFVMHAFPQGFRTWWAKLSEEVWLPVGYSGWYPMLQTAFELFKTNPEKIKDRTVVPHVSSQNQNPYLYFFNFSVAPPFKKTFLSKALMKNFVQDICSQTAAGLACITVSEDGERVARCFGMSKSGDFILSGQSEGVYIKTERESVAVITI